MHDKVKFLLKVIPFIAVFASSAASAQSPELVAVGIRGGWHHYIQRQSVRLEAGIVRYQISIFRQDTSGSETGTIEAGVDCVNRRRIEYHITQRFSNGLSSSGAAPSPEMRSVFEGTSQASELSIACQLASLAQSPPSTAQVPPAPPLGASQQPTAPPNAMPPFSPPPRAADAPQAPKSTGTGFVVGRSGEIATNFHVIEGCRRIQVQTRGGDPLSATVAAEDESNDLALLKLGAGSKDLPLPLASLEELGEGVSVLGFPLTGVLGADLRITTGVISSLSGVGGERKVMQISASVQPGNSGGPVLNQSGHVVGVVMSKLAAKYRAENVNFAIRLPVLRSFLEVNGISYGIGRSAPTTTAEIVKRNARSIVLVSCY